MLHTKLRSWVSNSVNPLQTLLTSLKVEKKSCETACESMQGSCGYIRTSFSIHRHWLFPSKPQSWVSNSVKPSQTLLTCLKAEKKSCETAFESKQGSWRHIRMSFSIHRHWVFPSKPQSSVSNSVNPLQTWLTCLWGWKKSCESVFESMQGSWRHIRTPFSIHRHGPFPSKPQTWVRNSVNPLQICWLENCSAKMSMGEGLCG
jgi:hypothetical protein